MLNSVPMKDTFPILLQTTLIDQAATAQAANTLLKKKKITGKALAEKVGVSPSYLSELRSGTRRWTPELAEKVAAVLLP